MVILLVSTVGLSELLFAEGPGRCLGHGAPCLCQLSKQTCSRARRASQPELPDWWKQGFAGRELNHDCLLESDCFFLVGNFHLLIYLSLNILKSESVSNYRQLVFRKKEIKHHLSRGNRESNTI